MTFDAAARARDDEAGESNGSESVRAVDTPAPAQPTVGIAPHFLSRLAHDIRSPLGLLSGALEEIREDLMSELDEGHQRMLALADRGLARLERMARTLSTVAQIESGSLGLSRETVDFGRIVREVVESVEREDPRRGLELELELPDGVKLDVDPERIREGLWELVAQVRRQAKSAVRMVLTDRPEEIELRIEDDGRGFDSLARRHAFDRLFEPADRRGTGLGLSVARDLMRAHGGDITLCDSTLPPGRSGTVGACFVLTLPR